MMVVDEGGGKGVGEGSDKARPTHRYSRIVFNAKHPSTPNAIQYQIFAVSERSIYFKILQEKNVLNLQWSTTQLTLSFEVAPTGNGGLETSQQQSNFIYM